MTQYNICANKLAYENYAYHVVAAVTWGEFQFIKKQKQKQRKEKNQKEAECQRTAVSIFISVFSKCPKV